MEEKIPKSTDTEPNFLNQVSSSPPNNEVTASESNTDPPNNSPLDSSGIQNEVDSLNDSYLDSSKKMTPSFLKSHWQHLCVSLLLAVCFITTSIGLIYAATSVGSGSGPGNPHYSAGGDPGWAIENIVAYMVTPMQLFPYEPVIGNAESDGKDGNVAGSKLLINGGKVGGKKLSESSYYGNTIAGADKGSIIFIPWYDSSFASSHSDWAREKFASYRYRGGKLSKSGSPFVVVFGSDDSQGTVDVGTKDPKVKNGNDGTEHIFTSELYQETGNAYDLTKLRDLKKAKLKSIAGKNNAKKQSTQLWAYISTPDGPEHTPQVRERINAYLSPMNKPDWLLQSNGDESDESSLTLQSLKKNHSEMYAVTCYHVVDLLLSLYSVSLDEEWLNIAIKYAEGWKTPTDGDAASVYDALAITPAVTAAGSGGKRFVIGLGDYIDYTLQNKETALVSTPETANKLSVTKNSSMTRYLFNLMESAVNASGNTTSSMQHLTTHSESQMTLGDLSLFLNVFGFRPKTNVSNNNSSKLKIEWKDNNSGNNSVFFQLNSDVWGSNLVFFPSTQSPTKEALPQFSVNLGRSSVTKDLDDASLNKDPVIHVPAKVNKGSANLTASKVGDKIQLQFQIDSKIDNLDDFIKKDIDKGKRELRDKKANKDVFTTFLTASSAEDLTLAFKVRRVVDTTDLQGNNAKRIPSGESPQNIKFAENTPTMKKTNANLKGESFEKAKSKTSTKHLGTKGISESLKTSTNGLDAVVSSKLSNEITDATEGHGINHHATGKHYQYTDFWVSYEIPNLGNSQKTYRYGLLASALGSSASEYLFSTIDDKTIADYGVYVFEGDEKYIPVTYKITEAYLAFKDNSNLKKKINGDNKEKKYQPYTEHEVFVNGSVKKVPAIRAMYTGEAVSVIYHFLEAPSLDLTVDASVGSLLDLTESGSATNSKDTGIEDIDVKLGTSVGYVKEGSSSSEAVIDDVPIVLVGAESTFDWNKFLKKKDTYDVFLTFFVKRTLSSEGTLPKNAEQIPFEFNFSANGLQGFPSTDKGFATADFSEKPIMSTTSASPLVPSKSGTNGKANGIPLALSGNFNTNSTAKLRGLSISKMMETENPGLEQMAVFSIKLDDWEKASQKFNNAKRIGDLFKKTAPMIGDVEAPETNTEKTGDVKFTGTGKKNTAGVTASGGSLDPRNNTLFAILDYSMAELRTEGFTDVTATYSVSVNINYNHHISIVGAPNAAAVASAPEEAESGSGGDSDSSGSDSSSDSASPDGDALPKASVTYYPAGPKLVTLDAAVDTKDTVPSDDYLAPDCTNVAVKETEQKSKHSDSKGAYYRKAHVEYRGSGTTINDYPTLWLGSDQMEELAAKIGPFDSSKKSYRAVVYRDGETVASTNLQSEGDLESAKLISLLQAAQSSKTQLKNITPGGSAGARVGDSTDPASDILVLRDKSVASIPIGENETKEFVYTMALEVVDLATAKTTAYKTNSVKVIYTSRPLEPDYLTELDGWVNVPGYEGQKKAEIPPENVDNGAIGDVPSVKLTVVGSEWAKDWKILVDDAKVESVKVSFQRTPSGGSALDLGDGDLPVAGNTISLAKGSSGFNAVMEALQNKTEGEFAFKDKSIANYPAAWSAGEDGDEEFQATFTYSAKVVISYETGSGVKEVAHDTNEVTLVYHSAKNKVINANMSFSTKVRNYAELKEGYVDTMNNFAVHENYEAMAGVPTTQKLYFSAGGNQFIVDINLQTVSNGKANRYYRSYFAGTDCEFKAHDQLRAMVNMNRTVNQYNVNSQLAHYTKLIPGELAGHYTQSDDQAKGNGYVQYSNIPVMKIPENFDGENKEKIQFETAGDSSSETYEEPYETTSDRKSIGAGDVALSSGTAYSKLVFSLDDPLAEGEKPEYKVHFGSTSYSDSIKEDYVGVEIQDHNTETPVKLTITGEIENESELNPGDNGSDYTSALGVAMSDGSATTIDSTNEKDKKYGLGGEAYKESVTVNYTTQVAKSKEEANTSVTDSITVDTAVSFKKTKDAAYNEDGSQKSPAEYTCPGCGATSS